VFDKAIQTPKWQFISKELRYVVVAHFVEVPLWSDQPGAREGPCSASWQR
jgi:hypothetical protein